MKPNNVHITKSQLRAIIEMANNIDAMVGCESEDSEFGKKMPKAIKLIDKFLDNNGYFR